MPDIMDKAIKLIALSEFPSFSLEVISAFDLKKLKLIIYL